jgi:hypothetical protein
MMASSSSAFRVGVSGTMPSIAFADRSLSAAILLKESPAARRVASGIASTVRGEGNGSRPHATMKRLNIVPAAIPLSC